MFFIPHVTLAILASWLYQIVGIVSNTPYRHSFNINVFLSALTPNLKKCHFSLDFVFQHIVQDERSDKEETDDSEDEDEDEDEAPVSEKRTKMKNGPLQNGHSAANNNHRKTE